MDEEGEAEEALARLRQELSGRPEAGAGNVLNLAEALALCPVERFRDCDWALQLLEEYDIDPADFGPDAAGASKILADIRRSCRAGGER